MKYAINYQKGFNYINEVDEIIVPFRRTDTTLFDFLTLHKNQRVIININDMREFAETNSIKLFDAMLEKDPSLDIIFRIVYSSLPIYKEAIKDAAYQYKFFFLDPISSWDMLAAVLNENPTDVYIVEELGFEIKQVAEMLHERGIRVRCFPNVAQSKWADMPSLLKFFIRPEDIYIYEPYVDVCELFKSEKSLNTLYKIYTQEKKWAGPLKELIISFEDSDLDSRFVIPTFAKRRLDCGKRCLKGRGCRVCSAIEAASATLKEHGLLPKVVE